MRLALPALACAAAAAVLVAACGRDSARLNRIEGYAQGTTYVVQWVDSAPDAPNAPDAPDASAVDAVATAIDDELERLDRLLSTYRHDSTLESFNAARSTVPQAVPQELVALVALAHEIHAASDGCFDPTVRPLVRAWGFDTDAPAAPPSAVLDALRERIGMQHVEIVDAAHLRKTVADVELDFSSIGQGYTASRLAAVLESHGIADYLVEIGGEIVARGRRADGTAWRVGIESPAAAVETEAPAVLQIVTIPPDSPATAVLTSGTYRKFFTVGGRRFSHILDPRTLAPVEHTLAAVTVVGTDGARAAAWATALVCLGPDAAFRIAERERVAALLLVERGEDRVEQRPTALFPKR